MAGVIIIPLIMSGSAVNQQILLKYQLAAYYNFTRWIIGALRVYNIQRISYLNPLTNGHRAAAVEIVLTQHY